MVDDVSKPARTVTARINTSVVDRYRTVIVPGGGDFRAFMATPAVLWQHGQDPTRGSQPIGSCSSVRYRRAEDDLIAVTRFKTDEYSDRIFSNYVDGTLTSFSVDFLPDLSAAGRPTPDELRARPDWAGAECVFRKWELTGYSAVAYPGNPEALALVIERGLWVPPEARDMAEGSGAGGGYATEVAEDDGDDRSKCRVSERDGKWCVMRGDEVVSAHDTEAEAMAACGRSNTPADETDAQPDDRTTPPPPPLPAGVRTYTSMNWSALTRRSVAHISP